MVIPIISKQETNKAQTPSTPTINFAIIVFGLSDMILLNFLAFFLVGLVTDLHLKLNIQNSINQ